VGVALCHGPKSIVVVPLRRDPPVRSHDRVRWAGKGIKENGPPQRFRHLKNTVRYNSLSLSKIISEHIDDAARIRWAELRGPLSLDPQTVGDGNEINVLVISRGRLQISADLDVKRLGKLKQMLEQY
jgi:hypothetical protein